MYENENKNMNGLGNENMEHRDVPETTVNWTTPGDGRSQQRQNTQGQNTQGQNTQGADAGFSPYGSQARRPDILDRNSRHSSPGGGPGCRMG